MDVKKSVTIFILASVFWLIIFTFFFGIDSAKNTSLKNKFGLDDEKSSFKKDSYTREQKEFIELFQSSFEDR
ncbi:hypothetical protein [Fluviispira sanaruensis]|uniref:Uncharacterized protein n=1 Tax=Fluviispira sanaruensis TaxID=2493639 RepID=A0A4P2VFU5_FLUSA|nr:hypothetical protein [Fluviispira sanaruensis]BBH51683.1 hypothetical protein JCM31447_309500 [Fluviispira sanaruensis]